MDAYTFKKGDWARNRTSELVFRVNDISQRLARNGGWEQWIHLEGRGWRQSKHHARIVEPVYKEAYGEEKGRSTMDTIAVRFKRDNGFGRDYSTDYHYMSGKYKDIKIGDTVVVDSPYGGYVTVNVVGIGRNKVTSHASKAIVDVVDDTWYKAWGRREERSRELRKLLDKKVLEFNDVDKYRRVAELDTEAMKLYSELLSLQVDSSYSYPDD